MVYGSNPFCYPGAAEAPLRVALKCLSSFVTLKEHQPTRRGRSEQMSQSKKVAMFFFQTFFFQFSWQPWVSLMQPTQMKDQSQQNHIKQIKQKKIRNHRYRIGEVFVWTCLIDCWDIHPKFGPFGHGMRNLYSWKSRFNSMGGTVTFDMSGT